MQRRCLVCFQAQTRTALKLICMLASLSLSVPVTASRLWRLRSCCLDLSNQVLSECQCSAIPDLDKSQGPLHHPMLFLTVDSTLRLKGRA